VPLLVRSPLAPLVSRNEIHQLLGVPWGNLNEIARRAARSYTPFDTHPSMGPRSGKWRHIDNPSPRLKALQRRILRRILATAPLPENMFGAMPGRDVLGHARCHVGQRVIVTLDLRDCFPRTHDTAVFSTLRKYFECSSEIAAVLTKLTTYHHRLPQGAPTSSFLAQLTLVEMLAQMDAVARDRSLVLSSYIDDIAWSGPGAQLAIGEMVEIIASHGHRIRCSKKHVMKSNEEKRITGLIVKRDHVTVPRSYVDSVEDRILVLSRRQSLTVHERASVDGQIKHVQRFDEEAGQWLADLARDSLPSDVSVGPTLHTFERRPCLHARRHRHDPTAAPTGTSP
jgi:RNA-directed DNA polymerase